MSAKRCHFSKGCFELSKGCLGFQKIESYFFIKLARELHKDNCKILKQRGSECGITSLTTASQ